MKNKLVNHILTVIEISGVAVLASEAIKAEWKRHKAETTLLDTEIELGFEKIASILKDAKIATLEKELEELKQKGEA